MAVLFVEPSLVLCLWEHSAYFGLVISDYKALLVELHISKKSIGFKCSYYFTDFTKRLDLTNSTLGELMYGH